MKKIVLSLLALLMCLLFSMSKIGSLNVFANTVSIEKQFDGSGDNYDNSYLFVGGDKGKSNKTKKITKKTKAGITIKIGSDKKITKRYKGGSFIKKSGITYYKNGAGKIVKKGFFTRGNYVYYANSKGELAKGWKKIKGHYYFFTRANGRLAINTKADGIQVSKYGQAKETTANVQRINTYIKAKKVVDAVTKPTDDKATKLYKCYKWMEPFDYAQYRTFKTGSAMYPATWDSVFANDIFDTHKGCCVSLSCAFAYMAKECGYTGITVCCDTAHAWVDIGGRLYDPLFAEGKSFALNYNAPYTDYRINAMIRKSI